MGIKEVATQDLTEAIKRGEIARRDAIRSILNAIHYAEIERSSALPEADVLGVIAKEVKLRRESIEAFSKGNRPDLTSKEEAELRVLLGYLPQQLSREEIVAEAKKVIAETGALGPKDKGKVMGRLMPQLKGKAEGKEASEVVEQLLSEMAKGG